MNNLNNTQIYIHQVIKLLREGKFYGSPPEHRIALCYYFGRKPVEAANSILETIRKEKTNS